MPSVAYHQVKYGFNASKTFAKINELLDSYEKDENKELVINRNVYMVMLQKILTIAPHVEHPRVVSLATRLLGHVSHVSSGMIIVTCLQSLPFPTRLPGQKVKCVQKIMYTFAT